jgi:hypothetical protein
MSSTTTSSYTLITICDIRHQDIYTVYRDDEGYYYDMNGTLINIDHYIKHDTSYSDKRITHNNFKVKMD